MRLRSIYSPILVERENTDGDRRIVETLDLAGLPAGTDLGKHIRERCRAALAEPATFRVRAIEDDPSADRLCTIWSVTV